MRRMTKARVKFISLVPKGANRLPVVYKQDGAFEAKMLCKELTEQGELIAVVYAPEFRDSQGDIASAHVIKDMAYAAAKEGVEIDIRHDGQPVGRDRAYIAENFLVQKGDPRFSDMVDYAGQPVDVTGAWGVVIKIEDEALRQAYRNGTWNGVSLAGTAEVREEKMSSSDFIQGLAKILESNNRSPKEEDVALKKDEIAEIAKATAAAVAEAMKKNEEPPKGSPAPTPAAKEDGPPKFEGDITKENIEKHKEQMRQYFLRKKLDSATSMADVDKILKEMDGAPPSADSDSAAEIARLQKRLQELQGTSKQPPAGNGQGQGETFTGLSKEDVDLLQAGRQAGEAFNKSRGYSK